MRIHLIIVSHQVRPKDHKWQDKQRGREYFLIAQPNKLRENSVNTQRLDGICPVRQCQNNRRLLKKAGQQGRSE